MTDDAKAGIGAIVRKFTADTLQAGPHGALYDLVINAAEKPLIESVLAHHGNNQVRAAAALGVSRTTLRTRMRQFGMLEDRDTHP
jgi:two-component system nitrogen regulation response regulator GlnG